MPHKIWVALEQNLSTSKSVAIIGGGACGLLCAIECAKASLEVTIFEKNTKAAKKILASGNGRCNISNTTLSSSDYFGEDSNFVSYALEEFGFKKFQNYVENFGLFLDIKEDGKAYPLSNEAKSVTHLMVMYAQSLGVNFLYEQRVTKLQPLLDKFDAIVIATGSQAASHLGGSEDGYTLAQEVGHTIVPTYPTLVQLELQESCVKKLAGIKLAGEVTLFINNKKEQTISGDILFTNYGVSGLAILDISHLASEALKDYQVVDISLNLLPKIAPQKLVSLLMQNNINSFTLIEVLAGFVPLKIAKTLLEELQINPTTKLNTKLAKKIVNKLQNWKFEVTQTHGFRHAEASAGGVSTKEIDPKTMNSKKHPKLYFCGEVIDVVGRRGGFNFAWAWASGYSAAKAIVKQ